MRSLLLLSLLISPTAPVGVPNTPGRQYSYVSTASFAGGAADGGANFSCPNNPANTSPCLSNPNNSLELGGACYHKDCTTQAACIYLGCMGAKIAGPLVVILNNYGGLAEVEEWKAMYNGDTYQMGDVHMAGRIYQSAVGYWHAGAGSFSYFLVPNVAQTTGDLFTLYSDPNGQPVFLIEAGSGAVSHKSTKTRGTVVLNGSGQSSVTVLSGATCTCTDQTSGDKVICPVSGTTASFSLGVAGHSVSYVCIG